MQQYIDFLLRHSRLSALLLVLIVLIIFIEIIAKWKSARRLTPHQAVWLMNRQNGIVVDIRELKLYQQGHIISALHLPFSNEAELIKQIKKLEPQKERPIIIICTSENRGDKITSALLKNGFKSVQILRGGMDAWQSANMPTEKNSRGIK